MMRFATWNVNSIKARLPVLLEWLERERPDVALLQEIKCEETAFPALEISSLGYHAAVCGQKTYNGVAVLSRRPIDSVRQRGLPGDAMDAQARYVEVTTGGVVAASLYVPNGNPVDTDKFAYKLSWLERMIAHAESLLRDDAPFVLGGDWNIAPADADVFDPPAWKNDALCRPESRKLWRRMINLGLTDAFRALHPEPGRYTWWDYRGGAWARDQGLRIDHILLSPPAADRLLAAGIDRAPRNAEKASDHTPLWCELDF